MCMYRMHICIFVYILIYIHVYIIYILLLTRIVAVTFLQVTESTSASKHIIHFIRMRAVLSPDRYFILNGCSVAHGQQLLQARHSFSVCNVCYQSFIGRGNQYIHGDFADKAALSAASACNLQAPANVCCRAACPCNAYLSSAISGLKYNRSHPITNPALWGQVSKQVCVDSRPTCAWLCTGDSA